MGGARVSGGDGVAGMRGGVAGDRLPVLVAPLRDAHAWPLSAYREAYTSSAGTALAALLAVWFLIVNLISPGSARAVAVRADRSTRST